jgi:hypothetical protein
MGPPNLSKQFGMTLNSPLFIFAAKPLLNSPNIVSGVVTGGQCHTHSVFVVPLVELRQQGAIPGHTKTPNVGSERRRTVGAESARQTCKTSLEPLFVLY